MAADAENNWEELVLRLRAGEEDAFTELVRSFQGRVYGLCYRMLNHPAEAEDVAQEVFVAIFRYIDHFRGEGNFSTWVLRIAANRCRNHIKYLKRRRHDAKDTWEEITEHRLDDDHVQRVPRPDQVSEGLELERLVREGLQTLDEDHREILILRDMEHLSYQEIAEVLSLAEGTVKSRLSRARFALRTFLSQRYALVGGGDG